MIFLRKLTNLKIFSVTLKVPLGTAKAKNFQTFYNAKHPFTGLTFELKSEFLNLILIVKGLTFKEKLEIMEAHKMSRTFMDRLLASFHLF